MEAPVTSTGDSSGATSPRLPGEPSGIPASQGFDVLGTTTDSANAVCHSNMITKTTAPPGLLLMGCLTVDMTLRFRDLALSRAVCASLRRTNFSERGFYRVVMEADLRDFVKDYSSAR